MINEILKHKYLLFLRHVSGRADETISKHEQAIHYYDICFCNEDFGKFNSDRAIKFKEYLLAKEFSGNSIKSILNQLKQFFLWLSRQVGYKRRIKQEDIEYLNSLKKDDRLANNAVIKEYPTLDYILELVNSIDDRTEIGRRNKALIAFTACTGMRDKAIMTIPIKCINLASFSVIQDPRCGVETKYSKYIPSMIFKFHEDLEDAIKNWMDELIGKGRTESSPLFPRSKPNHLEAGYSFIEAVDVDEYPFRSTVSIRKIFKESANAANLKYYIPHSFRDFAIIRSIKSAKDGLQLKAISQNFGHKDVFTTFNYYGEIPPNELFEILSGMSFQGEKKTRDDKIDEMYNWFKDQFKSK